MSRLNNNYRKAFFFSLLVGGVLLYFSVLSPDSARAADVVFPEEALADLVKPSVVRIAEHVTGTAKIPTIKVDIRKRLIGAVPDEFTTVPVDEYLSGSGFVIHADGYIATNAHVVSQETVKQSLASESSLSALFENSLFLSDQEMQDFLQSDDGVNFGKQVLRYVIDHSVFDLENEVVVLKPGTGTKKIADLIKEGFPAQIVSVNDNFLDDERDVAILKIGETNLPALNIGNSGELAVGKRAYIFGFPATAEVNQNNPAEATFTQGVVSAIKQSTDKSFNVFQTDAKVSEGSSGGPLFNDRGEVVGIITFETDKLSQVSGDNFAFALPAEIVTAAVLNARITSIEGGYGKAFRTGFALLSAKHCDKALDAFQEAKQTNTFFMADRYVDPYIKKCDALKQAGGSLDSEWAVLQGKVTGLGHPFFYLLGGGLFLFGIFGAAFFWLLRQVRREEREIAVLESRLLQDEMRIRSYKDKGVPERDTYPGPKKERPLASRPERKRIV